MKLELVLDEVDLPWSPDPEWTTRLSRTLEATSAADCVLQVVITNDETLREHNRNVNEWQKVYWRKKWADERRQRAAQDPSD